MIYEVSVAGEVALKRLETERILSVHSVFNNGMNLVNGDTLVFVGTNKNGYFPFGLTVDQYSMREMLQFVSVGDTITKYNNELRHNNFSLMLNQPYILKVNKNFSNVDIKTLYQYMNAVDFSHYEASDFNSDNMKSLIQSLKFYDENLESNLRFFIGRGKGLTPTGDDILTGILYANAIFSFIKKECFDKIKTLYNQNLTTLVSEQFVRLALNQVFSSRITDLHESPSEESIHALISLGSSSGLDTLYAIYKTLNQEWYE